MLTTRLLWFVTPQQLLLSLQLSVRLTREAHPSINFTMEIATNGRLPFVGVEIIKTDHHLETSVCRKKTNRGLLLHYQSHVDFRYKRSLLMTMLSRANWLFSSPDRLSKEYRNLKAVFLKLKYPERLTDSTINRFNHSFAQDQTQTVSTVTKDNPIRIILPFNDQISADIVRTDLRDLSAKINKNLQPIFTSRKFIQDLRVTENRPSLVNQPCVVYEFKCYLCDSSNFGYTRRHLFQRIHEHNFDTPLLGNIRESHNLDRSNMHEEFNILKECRGKLECLI